jgi:UMF1 family MFS transporter
MARMQENKKAVWAWALYDAGNSAFATVVMAGFFPVFFKSFWSAGADVTVSTARLGLANSAAGLAVALLAPLLGAIADRGAYKKPLLGLFTFAGCAATALLCATGKGLWGPAAVLFAAGCAAFEASLIFYDALLPSVADKGRMHGVSALGYSLGYLAGGMVFALCVLATMYPALLGAQPESVVRYSFLITALWWAVFTLPLLVYVPEGRASVLKPAAACREGLIQLRETFRQVRQMKALWLFLLAYWFYIEGVNSVIRMAVDYGLSLGFASGDLILALLLTQFVGFPCAILFGYLGRRWGARRSILLGIVFYGLIVIWGMLIQDKNEFYMLAAMVGLVQGGVQSLSRSLFAGLVPQDRYGQFFGFYNMVGKSSTVLGPVLVGMTAYLTGSPRLGIASLALLFIVGGLLLARVRPAAGETPDR